MKASKLLIVSSIIALTSCSTEADYDGAYLGTKSVWLESSPNDLTISNTTAYITKTSQGYQLTQYDTDLLYVDGRWFSNSGRIKIDTTIPYYAGYIWTLGVGTTYFDLIATERIETSIKASNSELEIFQERTYKDSLGVVFWVQHKDFVLDKQ